MRVRIYKEDQGAAAQALGVSRIKKMLFNEKKALVRLQVRAYQHFFSAVFFSAVEEGDIVAPGDGTKEKRLQPQRPGDSTSQGKKATEPAEPQRHRSPLLTTKNAPRAALVAVSGLRRHGVGCPNVLPGARARPGSCAERRRAAGAGKMGNCTGARPQQAIGAFKGCLAHFSTL